MFFFGILEGNFPDINSQVQSIIPGLFHVFFTSQTWIHGHLQIVYRDTPLPLRDKHHKRLKTTHLWGWHGLKFDGYATSDLHLDPSLRSQSRTLDHGQPRACGDRSSVLSVLLLCEPPLLLNLESTPPIHPHYHLHPHSRRVLLFVLHLSDSPSVVVRSVLFTSRILSVDDKWLVTIHSS